MSLKAASSNRGSLPEVLGKAERFFDPTDTENMAETLKQVLGDHALRKELSQTGLARAKDFLWNKAAKDMMVIFDELGNN